MKKNYFILLLLIDLSIHAQPVKVSIFNDQLIKTVVISAFSGSYTVMGDGKKVMTITEKNPVYVSWLNDKITVFDQTGQAGLFNELKFISSAADAVIKLRPVNPEINHRLYYGNFFVKLDYKRLLIINEVDLELYLAGVVEAECGTGRHSEFYKAHAVISRTYTLKNMAKHSGEGFNLCDGVHCQVYKKLSNDQFIIDAVNSTNDLVMSWQDTALVSATFFSNCGGETENAGNVWLSDVPYLRSVSDPYCTGLRNAHWTKTISIDQWKEYLIKNSIDIFLINDAQFAFSQPHRMKYYKIGDSQLLLKKIREDWDLKSTFFSIEKQGKDLIFKGRGYGHGVGLCQEGAMQMAKKGKSYTEILNFYYKGIKVVNYSSWLYQPKPANP